MMMKYAFILLGSIAATNVPHVQGAFSGLQPSCGDTILISTKLTEDLECDCDSGPALKIDGRGIILDMNDHRVSCNDTGTSFGAALEVYGKGNIIQGPGTVSDANNTGIALLEQGDHIVSLITVANTAEDGIAIASSSNDIKECLVRETGRDGLFVDSTSKRNNIKDNEFIDNGRYGLHIEGNFNIIENNVIDGSSNDGIRMYGFRNKVLQNELIDSGDEAMEVKCDEFNDKCGAHIIEGNKVRGTATNGEGIYVRVSNCIIQDNVISGVGSDSIYLDGPFDARIRNNVVKNNVVTDSGDQCIQLEDCDNSIVIGNTCNDVGDGVELDAADNTLVIGNFFTSTIDDGVDDAGDCVDTVVTRNTIADYGGDSIRNGSGTTKKVDDNNIGPTSLEGPSPIVHPNDEEDDEDDEESDHNEEENKTQPADNKDEDV